MPEMQQRPAPLRSSCYEKLYNELLVGIHDLDLETASLRVDNFWSDLGDACNSAVMELSNAAYEDVSRTARRSPLPDVFSRTPIHPVIESDEERTERIYQM